jgi:hypothetical protein
MAFERGVGEHGDKERKETMGAIPALAVFTLVPARLQADLKGRGRAHHGAARSARRIEVSLHRGVARVLEGAKGAAVRVEG